MRRPIPAVLTVLVLLLGLTAVATYALARQTERRAQDRVREDATEVLSRIDQRVRVYTEKLFGLRGLVLAGGQTFAGNRREFHRGLRSQELAERLPGIVGIGFGRRVADDDLAGYVARVEADARTSGQPYPPTLTIRPPGRRAEYLIADRVDPVRENQAAFGLDFLAEPLRRAAVLRARDTTRPAATARIDLLSERASDEPGVAIYLPVYDGVAQRPPAAERADRFEGVVTVVFGIRAFLGTALPDREAYDLEVFDLGRSAVARPRPENRVFDRKVRLDARAERSYTGRIDVGGRRWAVAYRATSEPLGALEHAVTWIVGGLGLIVSLLAAGVVYGLTTARARAVEAAERMTADLRDSRNELARRNEDLEQFAFLASHDLQQPLRTVSGFLQLLERQSSDRLDDRAREYVDRAIDGVRDMARLIDDLLAYSRAARADTPLAPIELDRAWDAAVAQLDAAIAETDATVTRDDLPVVAGDHGQMVQVFANLVGNAMKYRSAAPPRVHASAVRRGAAWEVCVQDNGEGIDPRDHERIFAMFRRLPGHGHIEGTGVGLAIVKKLVESAGGSIAVDSAVGAGARFTLTLAAVPAAAGPAPPAESPAAEVPA